MKKSKVLVYLSSLNSSELKKFEQFVASPYFNQRPELVELLRYLIPYHPEFPEKSVNKTSIIENVAFNKKNNEKELSYQLSFLFKLIEQFLTISKFEKDSRLKEIHLIESLYEKKLMNSFRTELKKKLEDMENVADIDSIHYYKASLLYKLQFRTNVVQRRTYDNSLQKASDYNDCYFFLNKLKYSCNMIDQSKFLKTDYDTNLVDETIAFIKKSKFVEEPIIAIYLNILNIVQGNDAKQKFKLLKTQIFEHADSISNSELKDIYIYAINFCARQIKKNNLAYLQEAFDLYLVGIKEGILLDENKQLTIWTYINVSKLGVRLKEYDLTKEFIFNNKDKIPKQYREDAFNYNLSEWNYSTKNYEEVIRLINNIKVNDPYIHSMSRITLCKMYFESFEIEPLLSLIASFSIFLKRDKKLAGNMKTFYKNFCDSLFQLLKRNQKKLPTIIEKIKTTEYISDREWLLQAAEKIQTEKKWQLPN